MIAGPVGDHGVVFLCAEGGSVRRRRQKMLDLAERASATARRRFRLSVHSGTASASPTTPLSQSYQAALGAAERALVEGIRVVSADRMQRQPVHSLRHLRHALGRAVEEQPDQLGAQFDRYVEAVAAPCGYRIEAMRVHLDVGFEQMAQPLVQSGVLDERSFGALLDHLDRTGGAARTTTELVGAYRQAVADLARAMKRPAAARHDRNLRHALEHIHRQYASPLRLAQVARLSGITPTYFSHLFKKRQGTTFEHYVSALRIERAKQLLTSTTLTVTRVSAAVRLQFARIFRARLPPCARHDTDRLPAATWKGSQAEQLSPSKN